MITAISLFIYSIFFLLVYMFTNRKSYSFVFILLMTSPSAKLLGLNNESFVNLSITYYLCYFILPVFLTYKYCTKPVFRNNVSVFLPYISPWAVGILVFITVSILYCLYHSYSILGTPYYFVRNYWCVFWVFLYVIYSASHNSREAIRKDFLFILGVMIVYSALLAAVQRFQIPLLIDVIDSLYNFKLRGEELTLAQTLKDIAPTRTTISLFSWANQFGSFMALMVVSIYSLYVSKVVSLRLFIVLSTCGVSGILLSASRTSIALLIIGVLLVTVSSGIKKLFTKSWVLLFAIPLIIYTVSTAKDERINALTSMSSMSDVVSLVETDRLIFWLNTLNISAAVKLSWLLGFSQHFAIASKESDVVAATESGLLTPFMMGGFPMTIMFLWSMVIFYKTGRQLLDYSQDKLAQMMGKAMMVWPVLFFWGEITQSWFQIYRIGETVIMCYAVSLVYLRQPQYISKCYHYKN